jgi:WD40 repeat protein
MEIRWMLRVWNIGTGKLLSERLGRTPSFEHGTDLSLLGTRMAVVEQDVIAIWDALTGRQVVTLPARATNVRFSQDGGVLASFSSAPGGDPAGPADLWDVVTGRFLRRVEEPVLAISPNGAAVLTSGEEIWSSVGRIPLIEQHGSGALAWLAGKELASGTGRGRVLIWDAVAGRSREALASSGGAVTQVAASSGGRAILTASADGEVAVLENGRPRLLGSPGRWIAAAAMSADGRRAAIAKASGAIHLWDAATGAELRTVQGDPAGVLSLTLSPDGRILAAGGIGGLVQAWDITTWRDLLSLRRTGRVGAMAFSPDGRLLAFGSTVNTRLTRQTDGQWGFPEEPLPGSHGELTLVDIATRREAGTLARADWTSALAFTGPRTLRAVSGLYGRPGAVRDYDASDGHEVRVVREGVESDGTAALSPDGEMLASGVAGLGIRVWKLNE